MKKIALVVSLVLVLSNLPIAGDQENQDIFEITLICPEEYEFRTEFAQIIADEFEKVGIGVTLDYMPIEEVIDRCFSFDGDLHEEGGFDAAFFGWNMGKNIDAEIAYDLFHSDNSVSETEDGYNAMSWENSDNDDLIDKMLQEDDETMQKDVWFKWQKLFYEEQPMAPIYYVYIDIDGEEAFSFQQISFNLNHPVLKKKRVRQALSHLIPRQKICNLHNKNEENQGSITVTPAEPCAVPVDPKLNIFDDSIKPYPYDVERAKELLFKSGFNVKTKKHKNAESLLEQAEQAFESSEFDKALDYAMEAKQLYEELGDHKNVTAVTSRITEYQNAINTKTEAEGLLEEGKNLKEQGEYQTAKERLLKAKQKFEELNFTQKVSEITTVITEIDEILRKESITQEADTLFMQGKQAFQKEDFENAIDYFEQAKAKYESVGSEKAAECDDWIEKAETEMEKGFCLGTIFLAILAGIGFSVSRRD